MLSMYKQACTNMHNTSIIEYSKAPPTQNSEEIHKKGKMITIKNKNIYLKAIASNQFQYFFPQIIAHKGSQNEYEIRMVQVIKKL